MVQEINKTLCAYPWRAAAIRPNGATIPCCRYPNLEDPDCFVDSDDPRNSEHWYNLREKMLSGIPSDGCKSCYQDEDNNLFSMRKESLTKFVPIINQPVKLQQLEVSFSNLCNLACVHCSSYFSTKWYSEDVKFNRMKNIGVVRNNFSFDRWDLSSLRELKIIGGEPFMEQKKFADLLRMLDLKKLDLQICTNGTILPNDEIKELIESCRNVYLCVSLDGLYGTNDWYRWPSKFDEVINNIKIYEDWWKTKKNIVFIIHTVINAINIFELEDIVKFLQEDLKGWKAEWDWIRWPHWQELSILPEQIKDDLISKFENLNFNYNNNSLITNPYKVTIERIRETPKASWEECKKQILNISNERGLDFLEMVPAFKSYWKI